MFQIPCIECDELLEDILNDVIEKTKTEIYLNNFMHYDVVIKAYWDFNPSGSDYIKLVPATKNEVSTQGVDLFIYLHAGVRNIYKREEIEQLIVHHLLNVHFKFVGEESTPKIGIGKEAYGINPQMFKIYGEAPAIYSDFVKQYKIPEKIDRKETTYLPPW